MHLDLNTPGMTRTFLKSPLYRKNAVVTIRPAEPGEPVHTVTANGVRETDVTCTGGEPVITNPGGANHYVIIGGWPAVAERYDDLGGGRYRAKGLIRAFRNPWGEPVEITAPWGEPQRQSGDCWLAMRVTEGAESTPTPGRYLIGAAEFLYEEVS